MCRSPVDGNVYAVGYADGSVRLWNQESAEALVTFHGHRAAVSVLSWDHTGTRVASGSRDCDIIIWDVLSETGLYRLKGHTNGVTDLCFVHESSAIVSASKDTFVKVWDLATQHCLETVVVHRTEVTALHFDAEKGLLLTFGADQQIRVFSTCFGNIGRILSEAGVDAASAQVLQLAETVDRASKERVLCVAEHAGYVCVLSADRRLEVFRANYRHEEAKKSKQAKKMLSSVHATRFADKPVSFDVARGWGVEKHGSLKLVLSFSNNAIQEWTVPLDKQAEKSKVSGVEFPGHRAEVRAVALSHDGTLLLSVAADSAKVWNVASGACVRSLDSEGGTCAAFVPGDKHVLLATKAGVVEVHDLVSGTCVMAIEAHTGSVWALQLAPDSKGFVTGGADKSVKFWEFKRDRASGALAKVKHIKTLQLADEVLAVRYSPDMRLLAVSLLDMTVKVFFEDSLKLSLSLYGHKLPVTSMDISFDGAVIVTVSSDKNIKVWSLQFGDCRKSIFAHQEAITYVAFLGRSTEFVTASKDRTVRYWDASKFVALQKITGHHGEIWAAAVSRQGDLLVTGSGDRSIRLWRKTDELLFPEEEKDREMDELLDNSLIAENRHEADGEEPGLATKQTVSAMKAGERIVEALEVADTETQKRRDYQLARENGVTVELQAPEPLLLAAGKDKTPAELVIWAVGQVPLAELEEALLTVPVALIPSLLTYAIEWFQSRLNLVLAARVLNLLLRAHYSQIMSTSALRVPLEKLRQVQALQLREFKDTLGYNLAAMRALAH